MKTRQLGRSDLFPTVLSFGAWGIGGPPFWTSVDEKTAIATIRRAFDLGVNCFDTAPVYGFGHSEFLVGKALKDVRHSVLYATKVCLRWPEGATQFDQISRNLSAASIRYEIEQSLKRLDTDVIDVYQVHWPDPNTPLEETFTVLSDLRREGKIRYIGVSNYSEEMIEEASRFASIVSSQPRYNMLDRRIEQGHLEYCRTHDIGVLAYSPLASGLLTGKYTASSTFVHDWRGELGDLFQPDVYPQHIARVERLSALAREVGMTIAHMALAWVLRQPGITSALVGANSPAHLEANLQAAEISLSEDVLAAIQHILDAEP